MRDRDKTLGIALIALGGLFLLGRVVSFGAFAWPLFVLVPGVAMLAAAFLGRRESTGFAVPGAIVTTVGLVLFVLNATDYFQAWAYCWALVIAGAGAGTFLQGALTNDRKREQDGIRTVYVGLGLFAAFGAFFELFIFGGFGNAYGRWLLPVALIAAGAYMLFVSEQRPSGKPTQAPPSAGPTPHAPPTPEAPAPRGPASPVPPGPHADPRGPAPSAPEATRPPEQERGEQ